MAAARGQISRRFLEDLAVCLLLGLAVWAVFGQTRKFDFVNYDDDAYVYDNWEVRKGLTGRSVEWALKEPQVANWIPLTTLSHMLDCQWFGVDAGGHHLVNVLWHAGTVVLLFLVLRAMTGALGRSALMAAIFAVHPLRAESVAWISERKDVMSGFFFVLTMAAYARHARKPSHWTSAGVIVSFCLGLLCKNMLITLPFVLLLLDYWPLRRFEDRRGLGRVFVEKDPLMVLAIVWAAIGTLVPGLLIAGEYKLRALARLNNALVSYAVYLREMFWPAGLGLHYPYGRHGPPLWDGVAAVVVLCGVTVWVVARRKEQPYLIVGWLWYGLMLAPVIGLVQISADAAHADRYTYLPEIGLTVAVIWAVGDWLERWPWGRRVGGALGVVVVGVLIVLGQRQTSYWKDSETIWRHTMACAPNDAVPYDNLGLALAAKGRFGEAIPEYEKSIQLDPRNSETHSDLASSLQMKGRLDEAAKECEKALKIDPDNSGAHLVLGKVHEQRGDLAAAVAEYRWAVADDPDDPDTLRTLNIALIRQRGGKGGRGVAK